MNELLNVDLQEQAPSAEETASGNAIVTLFEVYLKDSDLGGAGTDKLYFHDGTKSPADSYGSIQMYSPDAESSWGSTTASDYSLVTYTPFPFEFSGYERRTKGALPRPTIRFANVNRDFTVYNTNHDDLLGAKVIRRKTLAKYLLENPPVEFPKEIYYIERLVSENQIMVEFELTTNFDVQGVFLPSRRIVAARCPWKYKDSTVGGCDWPTDSTKDITDNNSSTTSQKIYVDVDDTYITAGNVTSGSAAAAYDIWGVGRSYTKDYFTEYNIPLAADYTITAVASVDSTHSRYTILGTSLGFSDGDYINVRGTLDDEDTAAWDHGEVHLKINISPTESGGTHTLLTVISPDPTGFDDWASSGLISKTRNTLFRCLRTHTSTAARRPGVATADWEVGEICGKRLTSCRMRYGYNPNAGSVEAVLGNTALGYQILGVGYSSAPTIAIAAPPAITFDGSDDEVAGTGIVNIADNTIKLTSTQATALPVNAQLTYNSGGGTSIGGLTSGNTYFIKTNTGTEVTLSATSGGTVIDITGVGTGTSHTFTGTTATATCTVSGGAINEITVTEAGDGYSSPPAVTVSGGSPSSPAVLIAICRGAAGEPDDVPLPFGGFPGAVTYS